MAEHTCTHTHACAHTCTHIDRDTQTQAHVHICSDADAHTCIHTYAQTHTMHTDTHTHAHTPSPSLSEGPAGQRSAASPRLRRGGRETPRAKSFLLFPVFRVPDLPSSTASFSFSQQLRPLSASPSLRTTCCPRPSFKDSGGQSAHLDYPGD